MRIFDERWPVEASEILKTEWLAGNSASKIAEKLNREFPDCYKVKFTRNAIIGRARRMELKHPGREKKKSAAQREVVKRIKKIQASVTHIKEEDRVIHRALFEKALKAVNDQPPFTTTLLDLKNDSCRWPSEDAKTYCGRTSVPGTPYCLCHARIAYKPAPPKRATKVRRI